MLVVVDFEITFVGIVGFIGGSEIAYRAMSENSLNPIPFSALN